MGMPKTTNWSALAGLLAFIFGFVGCADENRSGQNGNPDGSPAVPVQTVTVSRQDFEEVIDSIGTLEALQAVEIRPEITGIVQRIHFQEGQPVKAGDLLFTLDGAELRQRLNAHQAALEGASAEMRNAGRVYRRRRELLEERVIAPETRDDARTEFEAARARVNGLKAEIREIKERLQDTQIASPIDGQVGERHVDSGDFVEAGDFLVSVIRSDRLKVRFTVPERFMPRIKPDQTIKLRTAARSGKSFRGRVYFISPMIQRDTRHLLIKAVVDNVAADLRPGAFVTVKLIVGQRTDARVIPEEALIPTRTGYGVFVVSDFKAIWRPVSIGLRKPGWVEIREGVEAGEVVIRVGHISVSDGDRVRIVDSSD